MSYLESLKEKFGSTAKFFRTEFDNRNKKFNTIQIENADDLQNECTPFIIHYYWDSPFPIKKYHNLYAELGISELNPHLKKVLETNKRFPLRIYHPAICNNDRTKKNIFINKEFQFSDVFLMFNGFAESNIAVFDHMGHSLAENNIPSVFVPLPFHFSRHWLEDNSDRNIDEYSTNSKLERILPQSIFQSFYKTPTIFNVGLKQHVTDVYKLISEIRGEYEGSIFKLLFKKETSINLFGYSLGGLVALYLGMYEKRPSNKTKSEISKIILLESGASLDQITVNKLLVRSTSVNDLLYHHYIEEENGYYIYESFFNSENEERKQQLFDTYFEVIDTEDDVRKIIKFKVQDYYDKYLKESNNNKDFSGLSKEMQTSASKTGFNSIIGRNEYDSNKLWKGILRYLYTHLESQEDLLKPDEISMFKKVFFSDEMMTRKDLLELLSKDLLFIIGGADDIFPLASIQNISPDDGLAIVQVPSITHFIKHPRSAESWNFWKSFLTDVIISFINKR